MKILTKFIPTEIGYDGTQLTAHWIYRNFDILGNAVVSFVGPCDVKLQEMVDLEDVKTRSPIYSRSMLHFIGEFFDLDLEKTVYRQRLFMALLKDILEKQILQKQVLQKKTSQKQFIRRGDDIYDKDFKLTVSIATLSPISTLMHVGINIISDGTPVPTKGLTDYGLSAEILANELLEIFKIELESSWLARCKVREAN